MANYATHLAGGIITGLAVVGAGYAIDPEVSVEAACIGFAAAYVGGLWPDLDADQGIGLAEVSALISTIAPVLIVANIIQTGFWGLAALIPAHVSLHGALRRVSWMGERYGFGASVRAVIVAAACSFGFLVVAGREIWPLEIPIPGLEITPQGPLVVFGAMVGLALLNQLILPIFRRTTTHRGIFHSVPSAGIFALGAYLATIRYDDFDRLVVGAAALAAVLSHLILDEIYSVDLMGVRLKKSFGTALSLWKPKTPVISALAWAGFVGMGALAFFY